MSSFLNGSEFDHFRKIQDQVKNGIEMIKKVTTSIHVDNEYFEFSDKGEYKQQLEQTTKQMLQVEQNLGNYLESYRSTLFQVSDLFNEDLFIEQNENEINCEEMFKTHFDICTQASNNEPLENDARLKEIQGLLTDVQVESEENQVENANDEDFMIENSQSEHIPIDPFSQHEVEDPVRNRVCKHIYDKKGITTYINQSRKPRCPIIGCSNRQQITFNDLVEDLALKTRIHRILQRRKANAQ